MSSTVLWLLVSLGLAIVVVRRRSAALALLAAQSLLLGVVAVHDAESVSTGLMVPGIVLLARGIVLPLVLARVVATTREPRRIVSERLGLGRLVAAIAVVLITVAVVPPLGLGGVGAERAAVALIVLGILTAATRRPVVFQAIGFLVAENGVYLASTVVKGGLPGVIELGLLFDVIVIVAVIAAFGAKIHDQFGSGDTSRMDSLRD
jgi:hydrogenase-4 component E